MTETETSGIESKKAALIALAHYLSGVKEAKIYQTKLQQAGVPEPEVERIAKPFWDYLENLNDQIDEFWLRRHEEDSLIQPQTPDTGAAAVFGQWPGDETEEELLQGLREMED